MTQTVALDTLSLAALAGLYNNTVPADKQIKKFADKPSAVKRLTALAEGRVVAQFGDTYRFVMTDAELAETEGGDVAGEFEQADEPLPTSHAGAGSRFDVYAPPADAAKPEKPEYARYPQKPVQMGDALQQVLGEGAKTDVPPPAPATAAEKQAKAAKAKPVKAAKAPSTGHRGPQPRYADHMTIVRVDPTNPRRAGAHSHVRYELYKVGMTVAEYIDLCLKAYGRDRARWLTDVRWDCEAGHIAVE